MQFSVLTQPVWAGASVTPVAEAIHSITRKTPRGTKIARWCWPESHTTFSLLPDCLAARLPGELDHVEAVVAHAERAPSRSAAAKNGGRLDLPRDSVSGVTQRFPHISAERAARPACLGSRAFSLGWCPDGAQCHGVDPLRQRPVGVVESPRVAPHP